MKKIIKNARKTAEKIISVIVRIILLISYFIVITPFGLLIVLFKDYLKLKTPPGWETGNNSHSTEGFLKKQ
ncbi:MAG: hypothetical protein PHQ54_03175 [Candidatus Omnitrophica bacterium]|nr:hypothetical protein [Candidatus Omnitrophota bacterium]